VTHRAGDDRAPASPGPGDGPLPADEPAGPDVMTEAEAPGDQEILTEQEAPAELDRVAAERDEYLDALQRLKAEFDNYRRRQDRERQSIADGATRDLVRDLLPVMDNLERAVAALGDQGEGIVAGLEMVRGQLAGLLAGHGVEEIQAMGRDFDPTVHEAIAQVPSGEHAEGTVIEVVEKGYRHADHVLRPTRVVVAAGGPRT
jgi:molecular chaperone GrpE